MTSVKIIINRQNRASVLTGVLHLSALICTVPEFLLSLSDEKKRQHNLKRHIQSKHPRPVGGEVPCIKIVTPLSHPPTLEPFGEILYSAKMPSSENIAGEFEGDGGI